MGKEEKEERSEAEIRETGSVSLDENRKNHRIKLLTIIGEIEGHEAVSGNTKATKYEHLLPMLAEIEDSEEVDGLLILLNTLGGDVEAGLSIAEMEEVILSEVRLRYRQSILLLYQAERW